MTHDIHTPCRSCANPRLRGVLSLGKTPLANALLRPEELVAPEPTYPLDLALCPSCGLVQIGETVPPEQMFDEYPYFSSVSDTMVKHVADLAGKLVRERKLGPQSLVVEAASNDGYLLRSYQKMGVAVLGVEPAKNVAARATELGVPTRVAYFGRDTAAELARGGAKADVFHAHNVLAHVPDLNGFLAGVRTVLKDTGVAVFEFPYLKDLVDTRAFDTIYHEHVFYFSLTALAHALRRHGLVVADVERVPIHGGSLRVTAAPEMSACPSTRVWELLAAERTWGLTAEEPLKEFAAGVEDVKTKLRALLTDLKAGGRRVAAYGASAKGTTLLNYCGIGRETLEFVVDKSPAKQGRYTPGTHLWVAPPEKLLTERPDFTLLLVWNFAAEVYRQQAEYVRRGGRFVVPIPVPRVEPVLPAKKVA